MTKIIFVEPDGKEVSVDAQNGLSLLEVAHNNGISLEGACEGSLACSTCHIYVVEGGDTAPEPSEAEEDQLDFAPAVRDCSRLSCQCVPDGSENVVVELPSWKRNEVSEDH